MKHHLDLWEMKHHHIPKHWNRVLLLQQAAIFPRVENEKQMQKSFHDWDGEERILLPKKRTQCFIRSKVLIKPRDVCLYMHPKSKIFVMLDVSNIITQNEKKITTEL